MLSMAPKIVWIICWQTKCSINLKANQFKGVKNKNLCENCVKIYCKLEIIKNSLMENIFIIFDLKRLKFREISSFC